MSYTGSVELISGITPKNGQGFPLVNAPDVYVDDTHRLPDALSDVREYTDGKIADLKDDLDNTQNMVILQDAEIDIGDLVVGSTVHATTGSNVAVQYGTRTAYVDITYPILIKLSFDMTVYSYDIFTYTSHAVGNVAANPTKGIFVKQDRIIVLPPAGTTPCLRIGVVRDDHIAMTTDLADPTNDFYKIKNGITIYRLTNDELNRIGIPADSKATGDAIKSVSNGSLSLNYTNRVGISDNTDYDTLITPGNYYRGLPMPAAAAAHCPTELNHILYVFSTINNERLIQICQESSLNYYTFLRYYNGSTWTNWKRIATVDEIEVSKNDAFSLISGVRTAISNNSDLNTYITSGNYYYGYGSPSVENIDHKPDGLHNNFVLFVLTTINSNRIIQVIQESSLTPDVYIRYNNGSTWTNWKRIATVDEIEVSKNDAFSLISGVRTAISNNSDLDTYITSGNYYYGYGSPSVENIDHKPDGLHNNFVLFVLTTINSNRIIQVIQESSLTPDVYIRYNNGSTWTTWRRLITDVDINVNVLNAPTDNVFPKVSAGTTVNNGITVVSDGTGSYKISGTATVGTVYNFYQNTSAFPNGIKPGLTYHVIFDNPSLYTKLRMSYYKNDEWVSVLSDGAYDTVFTIPEDATGFRARLYFNANGLNSPEFELHPQMYILNSPGDIVNNMHSTYYPPMLTIIDDDGYGSYYTDLKPLCESKNVSIASAIITARMGVSTGYMTWDQVRECYDAGCEILSHGYNHKTDAEILRDETTAEELEKWYRMAKHHLEQHGIKSDILVYNNNTGNVIQCQQAARRVYKGAIHAAGYEINGPDANPYYIKRFNFTADSQESHTLQEMKDNIDALVAAGTGWDVWMIHTSSTGGWSSDEVTKLGAAIDYAREKGVMVVTAEYAMRHYYGLV